MTQKTYPVFLIAFDTVLVFRSNRAGAVYQEHLLKYNIWFLLAIKWLALESDENEASSKPMWDNQWWCHSLFHLLLIICTMLPWYECCWKWIRTLVHTYKHSHTHACLTPMFTCTHFDAYAHPCLGMRMHTQDIALAQHMHSHVFSSVHCTHTAHTHWYALTCILISASLTHSTCMPICTQMYSHQCIAHTQHVHADKHAHVFSLVHCTHTCMPTDTRFLWKDILFYNQMK